MVKRVSELKQGETGNIFKVERNDALGIRLMELGLTPGTSIQFLRMASPHGPLEYVVRGYRLILGLQEAQSIYIQLA